MGEDVRDRARNLGARPLFAASDPLGRVASHLLHRDGEPVLRKALIDERTQWLLRIRSVLYHHGVSQGAPGEISGPKGREFLASLPLPLDASERVVIALRMIDMLDAQIHELERGLRKIARHQAGCQALMTQFGVGELIALVTLTSIVQ